MAVQGGLFILFSGGSQVQRYATATHDTVHVQHMIRCAAACTTRHAECCGMHNTSYHVLLYRYSSKQVFPRIYLDQQVWRDGKYTNNDLGNYLKGGGERWREKCFQ